eukprot:SAG22_NODE_8631_length_640_cov_1.271719_1_plen_162_part_01
MMATHLMTSATIPSPALLASICVAASHAAATAAAGAAGYYGPGRGAWEVADPEDHGLSSPQLKAAGERVAAAVPYRHCFVVVKDGKIVHELFAPGNNSETKYETDSVGKTMTATMFGTAVTQGLLDLDKPLIEYGVARGANWSVSGVDFFPNATARHILSQS